MKQAHAVFSAAAAATVNNNGNSNVGLDLLTAQNGKHSSTTMPHTLIGKEINNNNSGGNSHNVASTTPNSLNVATTQSNNNSNTNGLNLTQLGHFNQISEVNYFLNNFLKNKLFCFRYLLNNEHWQIVPRLQQLRKV